MVTRKYCIGGRFLRIFLFAFTVLFLLISLSLATFYTAGAFTRVVPSEHCDGGDCCINSDCSCPNCDGRGDPGGVCDICGGDLCEYCGNCHDCGTNPCPMCREHDNEEEDNSVIIEDPGNPSSGDPPLPEQAKAGINFLLFAPFGTAAWSIFNVVLTLTGVVLAIITVIRSLRRKKEENSEIDKQTASLFSADPYIVTQTLYLPDDFELFNKRRRTGMLAAMYVLSIGAVLLLILVQDFTGAIAVFDWWSIIHSIVFACIVICGKLVFRKNEKEGSLICVN